MQDLPPSPRIGRLGRSLGIAAALSLTTCASLGDTLPEEFLALCALSSDGNDLKRIVTSESRTACPNSQGSASPLIQSIRTQRGMNIRRYQSSRLTGLTECFSR